MDSLELAYTAGFVDADGCITISRRKHPSNYRYYYCVNVKITQKVYLTLFSRLKSVYGGTTSQREARWNWRIHSAKAGRFLADILPYLRLKQREAEIALELTQRKRLNERKRLTEVECEYRGQLYEEMKRLKHAINREQKSKEVILDVPNHTK